MVKDGKIIEQGKHLELLEQKGYYYQLVRRQFTEEESQKIARSEEKLMTTDSVRRIPRPVSCTPEAVYSLYSAEFSKSLTVYRKTIIIKRTKN